MDTNFFPTMRCDRMRTRIYTRNGKSKSNDTIKLERIEIKLDYYRVFFMGFSFSFWFSYDELATATWIYVYDFVNILAML